MIDIDLDAAVGRVVFVLVGDAAAFGRDEIGGDVEFFRQKAGYLLCALLRQVEVIGFGAFVVGVTSDQDTGDIFVFQEGALGLEDGGVGEMVAIEFEVDIGDAEGIDVRGRSFGMCRAGQQGNGIGFFFWRGRVGGVGVTPVDGIERVPDVLAFGAALAVEGFQYQVGHEDIG